MMVSIFIFSLFNDAVSNHGRRRGGKTGISPPRFLKKKSESKEEENITNTNTQKKIIEENVLLF
jgi:hypothetical protein